MKILVKIFFIIAAFIAAPTAHAQSSQKFGGAKTDTLYKSDTLDFVYQLPSAKQQIVSMQLYNDRISGSPKYTAYIQRSNGLAYWNPSGINNVTLNTQTDTAIYFDTSAFYGQYLRVRLISDTTTQKSLPQLFIKTW